MSSANFEKRTEKFTNAPTSKILFAGALLLGVGGSYFASPLVGIPLGALVTLKAFEIESNLGDCEEAVEDGLIAPFLSRADLFVYSEKFGNDVAMEEIRRAQGRNLKLSGAAEQFYKMKLRGDRPAAPAPSNGDRPAAPAPSNGDRPASHNNNPFNDLLTSQLVIFSGSMGSGKSTRLAKLVELHVDRSDFVLLLNPFSKASEWQGLAVAGRKPSEKECFEDVELALKWFSKLVEARSRKQRLDETYNPLKDVHVHLVLEEMTDWASHVKPAVIREFWQKSLRTLRQLNLSISIATHATTLAGLGGGGASGYKAAIVQQAEIFKLASQPNPNKSAGRSPKIPALHAQHKPANETEFGAIAIPETFKPESMVFDFRPRTKLQKFPDWRSLVGLTGQSGGLG